MNRKIQEQALLQEELKSLPKGASVYKQQQNSNIFFKTTKDKVFEECKKTLDSLVQEYKDVDTVPTSESLSEGQTDGNG